MRTLKHLPRIATSLVAPLALATARPGPPSRANPIAASCRMNRFLPVAGVPA